MGKLTEKQKLLECLFGHHDFFTSGCVRQCKRCRVVQVSQTEKWVTVKLKHAENFDLEAMTELQKLIDAMNSPYCDKEVNKTNDLGHWNDDVWTWYQDSRDKNDTNFGPKWSDKTWVK